MLDKIIYNYFCKLNKLQINTYYFNFYQKQLQMGNQMCSAIENAKPNYQQKIKEKKLIDEAASIVQQLNFIIDNNYTQKIYKMTILKMLCYNQNHLVQHLKNQKSVYQRQIIMSFWKNNNYEELDLYYQNLVKKEQFQVYVTSYQQPKTVMYDKLFKITQRYEICLKTSTQFMKQQKFAIFLFTNYFSFNSSNGTQGKKQEFDQFTDLNSSQDTLFSLTMNRLQTFADTHNRYFPFLIIYYRAATHTKITKFLKNFKYSSKVKLCMVETRPILNQYGQICLKSQSSHQFIEAPKGEQDFLNSSCKGQKIIQLLNSYKIRVGITINCVNVEDNLIDLKLIGSLLQSEEDVYYKCFNLKKLKEFATNKRHFKRVVSCDNHLQIKDYQFFQEKAFLNNLQKVQKSPLWLGSFIFKIQEFYEANKKYYDKINIDALIQTKRIYTKYWNPYIQKYQQNMLCYKFSKDITNLFMNIQVRPLGIQLTEDQFHPIFSLSQYNQKSKKYQDTKRMVQQSENMSAKNDKN